MSLGGLFSVQVLSLESLRQGRWREISGEGERESDWETSCDAQWKFWSLIGHLIYWSYRGDWASDYLRDYLVPVCFSFFLSLSHQLYPTLSLSATLFLCLPLSYPGLQSAALSSSQTTAFMLLYMNEPIWYDRRSSIRAFWGFCCTPAGNYYGLTTCTNI